MSKLAQKSEVDSWKAVRCGNIADPGNHGANFIHSNSRQFGSRISRGWLSSADLVRFTLTINVFVNTKILVRPCRGEKRYLVTRRVNWPLKVVSKNRGQDEWFCDEYDHDLDENRCCCCCSSNKFSSRVK